LIRGESVTGKELVARAVHASSYRGSEPFVPINCTVLPPDLLASELFGHRRGAFTGAETARNGLFVEADGGSLFLDEIGDMPEDLQTKLLRVLEHQQIRPVGADTTNRVDVRILAATHRDLEAKVESGEFREDLYYRLNVVPVYVPPLDERREDISLLIDHFIRQAQHRQPHSGVEAFDDRLTAHLRHRPWPGNVRQLRNVVERVVALTDGPVVGLEDYRSLQHNPDRARPAFPTDLDRLDSLTRLTDRYIQWVVDQCHGNKRRAAEILEIDPSTIYRRLAD
ncbi:MAG: sigma-54 interaction domain-containing protein, partial [Bradymonadaceae bacterium]